MHPSGMGPRHTLGLDNKLLCNKLWIYLDWYISYVSFDKVQNSGGLVDKLSCVSVPWECIVKYNSMLSAGTCHIT